MNEVENVLTTKNSPFKFKSKNLPKGVVSGWMDSKPIRLRNLGTGSFVKNTEQAKKQASFLIGKAIATKGLSARNYFKDAIDAWNAGTLLAFTYSLSATTILAHSCQVSRL